MIAEQFARLGMTAGDASSRARLIDSVTRGFTETVGAPPEWRWFVPGRLEVFGKHTDYAGGRSLLAAVPRGFAVAAGPRPDARVRAIDVRDGSRTELDLAGDVGWIGGWGAYVQVVATRLRRNFAGAPLGADIAILSDLPRAAGLSSSSALVVGLAAALARRASLQERDEWRASIGTTGDLAGYLGCVENGLDYRRLPGTAGVGTHGGSEDHTAILACRAGCLSQYRFVPVAHVDDTPMPGAWTFVVASSGVRADKSGSVMDRYNRASLMARTLLDRWNGCAASPAASLSAALAAPGAADRLRDILSEGPPAAFSPDELEQRLAHFIAEDARVPEAASAFGRADEVMLGRLSDDSQRQAGEWLGNQIPETRILSALAREHGAIAASSFGAGFGGSVWALIEAPAAGRFAAEWMAAYTRQFPARSGAEWFVAPPGPSMTEVE